MTSPFVSASTCLACLSLAVLLAACTGAVQEAPSAQAQIQILRQKHAPALYELAYSAEQQAVFVACAGGFGDNARLARVLRLNPETLDLQGEIPLQAPGLGVTLDDDNHRLYVGNGSETAISVIDTRSHEAVAFIRLAEKAEFPDGKGGTTLRIPHGLRELRLDSARQRLFAPGLWSDTTGVLYVVDTQTMTLEKTIPGFGFGPAGIVLDAQAGKVYVSNLQGQLFRVDAATLELEQTFEIAADQLLNLAFDPKRRRIIAVDQGAANVDHVRENIARLPYEKRSEGNRIIVINPEDGSIEHSIESGTGPVNLLLDPQRERLYVTNRGSGTVSIHDAADAYRLLDTVVLPDHPNSLSLDAQTGAIFLTVKNPLHEGVSPTSPMATGAESVARIAF